VELSHMTFQEILFHGRYHIIGGIMFLVFLGAFVREAVREFVTRRQETGDSPRPAILGPIYHDALIGATMTDGGEPVDPSATPGADRT